MPASHHLERTELQETLTCLALTRAGYASLMAAARATVAAASAGHLDPVVFVRDLLAGQGLLPEPGAVPCVVLADARTALALTAPAHCSPELVTVLAGTLERLTARISRDLNADASEGTLPGDPVWADTISQLADYAGECARVLSEPQVTAVLTARPPGGTGQPA